MGDTSQMASWGFSGEKKKMKEKKNTTVFPQQVVNKSSIVMDHSYKSVFKCSQPHVASVLFGSLITNSPCCKWNMEFLLHVSLLTFNSFVALLKLFFGSWYFRRLFLINVILLQCLVISLFWTKNLFHERFPIEMLVLVLCTTWIFPQGWNVIFPFNSL